MNHARRFGISPSDQERALMKEELNSYIASCYDFEKEQELKDLYVTDHQPIDAKYTTDNEEEDADFYEYQKSLEEYNSDNTATKVFGARNSKYERGSLLQRIIDPFAGAGRDEFGSIIYNVNDKELQSFGVENDEQLRAEWERLKAKNEVWETDEEDETAFRLALVKELEENTSVFKVEDFHDILNKELGVFKKGEQYDFSKDLKEAYKDSLKTSTEQKILATIPDHVFWDIKKPQQSNPLIRKNRYNPFRGREFDNFFDMRATESWMDAQSNKVNLNDSCSMYRKY
jgi:DUF2075 family protein